MISGRRQTIDIPYVKANASMDSLVEKKIIEDYDNYQRTAHDDYGNTIHRQINVLHETVI